VASLGLAGCASQAVPTVPALLPSSSIPAAASPSGAPGVVAGGCGSTRVFAGPGPDAQGPNAIAGLAGLRWAPATPAEAGITAYFFRPTPELLVVQPSPSGPSNKILWVTDGSPGANLVIAAYPAGSASPPIHFSFPATGLDYPSEIDLPTAGCWQLELGSSGATIDVLVGATGADPASPSPWWAVGGLTTCGHPVVARVRGQLTYLGGCDGNLGEPPTLISVSVGESFELHMTTDGPGGPPLYPLPTSSDTASVRLVSAEDAATATYQAIAVGNATLMSNGNCDSPAVSQFSGPCPVLLVEVTP
jgi:hypothetical protein